MVSKATDSLPKLERKNNVIRVRKWHGKQPSDDAGSLVQKMNQIKKQIQAQRTATIREKIARNWKNIEAHVLHILSLPSIDDDSVAEENGSASNMLSWRVKNPLCKLSGCARGFGDKDLVSCHDYVSQSYIKLGYVERLPPFTTWIFLDRNQRMADDQSVLGKRRIYYNEEHGSEALICSDSEEETPVPEEEKHEFSAGEDQILTTIFSEHGLDQEVVKVVSNYIGATASETEERYKTLEEKDQQKDDESSGSEKGISLDKSLSSALDSFDNLFCRRCMVFDCRLHGCTSDVIYPTEKHFYWSEHEDDRKPCSDQCYLMLNMIKNLPEVPNTNIVPRLASSSGGEPGTNCDELCAPQTTTIINFGASSKPEAPRGGALYLDSSITAISDQNTGKRKVDDDLGRLSQEVAKTPDDSQCSSKKHKKVALVDIETRTTEDIPVQEGSSVAKSKRPNVVLRRENEQEITTTNISDNEPEEIVRNELKGVTEVCELTQSLHSNELQVAVVSKNSEWRQMEKDLYMKGLEIFGRNSCLIARNLLSGLKTCLEVSCYMYNGGVSIPHKSIVGSSSFLDENGKTDTDHTDQEMPSKLRLIRRRGKARKLKYSTKSPGHPSMWKRIADGKHQSKLYTPCDCTSMCGKECTCLKNGTCCEKYCGCSKSCKNRFRGCHCAKSQCRSRQCPCFAAGRECDPDVCRNCWVSCGDGTLEEPPRQGDGQCGNMRLLLRQQQRILLAKSDVAGWGAFIKNSVNKNDYLGEYTGEIISHREADKRGKIYDRANSSFLFDLNEQYVLDAYRKGDKLKFANHSSNPNCYAKVMLVAGDHRVGIFAKEHIEASEELFYDYRYGPDQAPVWARKPEGSKRDDSTASQGRARKHQSH